MQKILFAISAFLIGFSASAQNPARIDISGVPAVKLNFKKQSGVRIGNGSWLKPEHAEQYMTALFPVSEEWKEGTLSFTPENSGKLRISLLGPMIRGGKTTRLKPEGVYYDNIRINGRLIPNGDFESGEKGFSFAPREKQFPGRIIFNPALARSGNACALAWHDGPVAFSYPVKAKEPVTVSFDYRSAGRVPSAKESNQFYPLSLASSANMGFADETAGDGRGGWTDQGPKNDLRALSPGVKVFCTWPFRILDPEKNGGRSCVIFRSVHSPFGTDRIVLPINRRCNSLALLNACAWGKTGAVAATVEVLFANGTQMRFPLIAGKQTRDWWNPKRLENAYPAVLWNNSQGGTVGVYVSKFKLSADVSPVSSVTFRSVNQAPVWIILGATLSDTDYSFPDIRKVVTKADRKWRPLPPAKPGVIAGSALDRSALTGKTAVTERVIVNSAGQLALEGSSELPVRFLTVADSYETFRMFQSKKHIEEYARQLRL